MNNMIAYDNKWLEFIDSFPEGCSALEIVAACINKFGDGGLGLTFSNWGIIVRDYLYQKTINSIANESDVSLNEPNEKYKDNSFKGDNASDLKNSVDLNNILDSIYRMKCSNRDGYKAPHKAIYILSIFDCIESRVITNNRFQINSVLLHKFEYNWKKYVAHLNCFSPNIWNPIFYMEDSIVHKVYNTGFEGVKPNRLKRCEVVFNYLEIPRSLWDYIQNAENLNSLRNEIIDTYISNNKSSIAQSNFSNVVKMKNYWIIPGNLKIFRISDYFKCNDIIDWKQSHYKFTIGDIVFIYISNPISSIRYMLEVVKCDIPYEDSLNDEEYWTSYHEMADNVKYYKYVRLKLLKFSDSPFLHLNSLAKYGLSVPQGATHNLSNNLVDYILSQFE